MMLKERYYYQIAAYYFHAHSSFSVISLSSIDVLFISGLQDVLRLYYRW